MADRPIAAIVGWALWCLVALTTAAIAIRRVRHRVNSPRNLSGPLPCLILLGVWLCGYRFMYYDVFLAAVGVVALMTDPRPFFRRSWWPFASWAAIFVGVMLLIENATSPLNVEVTASIHGLKGTIPTSNGSALYDSADVLPRQRRRLSVGHNRGTRSVALVRDLDWLGKPRLRKQPRAERLCAVPMFGRASEIPRPAPLCARRFELFQVGMRANATLADDGAMGG